MFTPVLYHPAVLRVGFLMSMKKMSVGGGVPSNFVIFKIIILVNRSNIWLGLCFFTIYVGQYTVDTIVIKKKN